jgi:glutamate-1-semialdehyde aminotransferase
VPSDADRSLALFPGGSLGEYNLPPDQIIVLARGHGAAVWDTTGRRWDDFTMGWGRGADARGGVRRAGAVLRLRH